MADTENGKNASGTDISEEGRHVEPKINYVIYTIISILLFLLLLFGYKFISKNLFRDYYMQISADDLTEENISFLKSYSGIGLESVTGARLEHTGGKNFAAVYFDGIEDAETFAGDCILYEYGDAEEDIRIEIFPYGNSVPEYAFASCYVNIEDPGIFCYVYEYDGDLYAEYHSDDVSAEFAALFSKEKKVYIQ